MDHTHLKSSARVLGRTGLVTSRLGFGAYRVAQTDEHAKALHLALMSGIRLVDTSSNYADGESETLIGGVISSVLASGSLQREDIIVVSKVGYVQGQNMTLVKQRISDGNPYPEVVEYSKDCWHSIHPDFISDQLTLSLQRLRMSRIDVYLLHNPEYYFSAALKASEPLSLASLRRTFYDRIRRAFIRLEEEAARGRISFYGVSSNSFVHPEESGEFTSVARMLEIARELGLERGDTDSHRFGVIQLPANLIEQGAFTEKNNAGATAVAYAAHNNLGVMINRPLNAITEKGLTRLADIEVPDMGVSLDDQLTALETLEIKLAEKLLPLLGQSDRQFGSEAFRWSETFREIAPKNLPPDQWPYLEHQVLRPHLSNAFRHFTALFSESHAVEWAAWRNEYWPQVLQTLQIARCHALKNDSRTTAAIRAAIAPHLPESLTRQGLARQALDVIANYPGVSCVLNGMRHGAYIRDAAAVLREPPFDVGAELFEAVRNLD